MSRKRKAETKENHWGIKPITYTDVVTNETNKLSPDSIEQLLMAWAKELDTLCDREEGMEHFVEHPKLWIKDAADRLAVGLKERFKTLDPTYLSSLVNGILVLQQDKHDHPAVYRFTTVSRQTLL